MSVLMLLAMKPDPATVADAKAGEIPYPEYLAVQEATDAVLWNYHDVERATHPLVKGAKRGGDQYGLAMLGFLHRHEFDQIYCTGEDVAMWLALLMKGMRDFGRITAVIHNAGTPKRKLIMRTLGSKVWRNTICLSDEQARVLSDEIKIDAEVVHRQWQWLDTDFYNPDLAAPERTGYAFSCGQESRDYATLAGAARGLKVQFRVKATGWAPHAGFKGSVELDTGNNIEIIEDRLSYGQLRDAYAGSSFVIAPIHDVSYAAGVTSICEAMSMGKAVIASASPGIIGYVQDGVTGLLVPPGDVDALRDAIGTLADDPERCAQMGAEGQAWVRREMRTRQYALNIAELLDQPTTEPHERPELS